MKVKAVTNFSGPSLTMSKGEIRDYDNEVVISDLLEAGYIETLEEKKKTQEPEKPQDKKQPKRSTKQNEGK